QGLFTPHDQGAAGQHLVNHHRNRAAQRVLLGTAGRAIELPGCRSRTAQILEVTVEQGRYAYAQTAFLADTGSGALTRLGRLFQHDGEDVTDIGGPPVADQKAALARAEQATGCRL